MNRACSQDGVRVLFDGHDGDSIVSYGKELFFELSTNYKFLKLFFEYRKFANRHSMRRWRRKLFRQYLVSPHFSRSLKKFRKKQQLLPLCLDVIPQSKDYRAIPQKQLYKEEKQTDQCQN